MPVKAPLPSAPEHSSAENAAHPFFNEAWPGARVHCRIGDADDESRPTNRQIACAIETKAPARVRRSSVVEAGFANFRQISAQCRRRTEMGTFLLILPEPHFCSFTFLVSAGSRSATSDP
jgi:hypothetical protein